MLDIKNESFEIHSSTPSASHIKLESTDHFNHIEDSPQPCTSKSLINVKKENTNDKIKIESDTSIKPHEQCPICLSLMKSQLLARPIDCKHNFCLECIEEWSRVSKACFFVCLIICFLYQL